MTREEIHALSGRELDEAVAVQVMGWHRTPSPLRPRGTPSDDARYDEWRNAKGTFRARAHYWHPTTDLNQAMQVAERAGVFKYSWCLELDISRWAINRYPATLDGGFDWEQLLVGPNHDSSIQAAATTLCHAALMVMEAANGDVS